MPGAAEQTPLLTAAQLAGLRAGDRTVLHALYQQHVADVARVVRLGFSFTSKGRVLRCSGVRNPFDEQDVLQEVFSRAFSERARLSFDGRVHYLAYLRVIAKNAVIDYFRRRKLSESHELLMVMDIEHSALDEWSPIMPFAQQRATPIDEPATELTPSDVATWRSSLDRFEATLPLVLQRFVKTRWQRGLSQVDAAKKLGVSRSRVRTWDERVRQRLWKHLQAEGLVKAQVASPKELAGIWQVFSIDACWALASWACCRCRGVFWWRACEAHRCGGDGERATAWHRSP